MAVTPNALITITAFEWVPPFAQGYVRDLRLRWACEEAGFDYAERLISAMDRPDWFYREQPWGQVPVLKDGALHFFESGACLLHLGDKSETLLASSGQARADALSWLFAALNSIEPFNFEMARVKVFSRDEEWAALRLPSLAKQAGERLDCLSTAIEGREWLAGAFSIADIMLATVLRESQNNGFLEDRSVLREYLERAIARPAFERALASQLAPFGENAPKAKVGE